jgi:glycosyltransferase involved in cell wall biosynthesis
MERTKKASVIIPTLNREVFLRNLLESLSKQQTDYAFEVIVVNDSPQDDLSPLELEFSDIGTKVVNLREDHGRSVARNAGVRHSDGDILIFLDDDMTVSEDFITRHMDAHVESSCAVIGNVRSAPQYARDPFARYIERQGARKRKPGERIPPQCFRTGNASVSREMFSRAGMFDETLRTYGEDLDLAMNLSYHGATFVFDELATSYNHDPPDIDDMMRKVREWGEFTLPIFTERHPELIRALWVHLAHPIRLGKENPLLSLRKIGLRLALVPPLYRLARRIYRLKWLGRLLFPVIDFIRVYNYIGAYRRAGRNR